MNSFTYMTGEQLSFAMSETGWDVDQTADRLGQRRQRVLEWLHDRRGIPRWVALIFTAATIPDALAKMETVHHFLNEQEHNYGMDPR